MSLFGVGRTPKTLPCSTPHTYIYTTGYTLPIPVPDTYPEAYPRDPGDRPYPPSRTGPGWVSLGTVRKAFRTVPQNPLPDTLREGRFWTPSGGLPKPSQT